MDLSGKINAAVTKYQTLGRMAQDKDILHIGYGFDVAYVRPMGVSLTSIAVNNPDICIHAHLFNNSLGDGDLLKFETLIKQYPNLRISLYHVDDTVINMLPTKKKWSLAIYFRLMMPIVLNDIDRLLYLDSDVLCLGGLSELMKLDIENKTALVVSDVDRTAPKRIKALELKSGKYFNSGIMIIDIKKWNEQEVSEQTCAMLCNSSIKFSFFDQDVLNLILENKVKYIEKNWNLLLTPENDNIPPNVNLLHCTAGPKPWKIFCYSNSQPLFLHYQDISPWRGTPLLYPQDHREAKMYAKLLFKKRIIKDALVWYKNYVVMKINEKINIFSSNR